MIEPNLTGLCKKLNYQFKTPSFLTTALTHRSVSRRNNERLEFLGDSVLNFVISSALYNLYPKLSEGELSRLRAKFVNKDFLAKLANEFSIGDYLILGTGELKSGGHRRDSILADAIEAIYGAVFIDAGFEECRDIILKHYGNALSDHSSDEELKDSKTRLQELLQSQKDPLPDYQLIETMGKPHNQVFKVKCSVKGVDEDTVGVGNSRRKAEQVAAKLMLKNIES